MNYNGKCKDKGKKIKIKKEDSVSKYRTKNVMSVFA